MSNIMDVLRERGFIKQTVYEDELYKLLETESVPFYIGFDPTADSLHVGHFLQLMAMSWMQKAGHKPIVLIGGGTAMIGDPSGRSDMRSMMTKETIQYNCDCFKQQMSKFFTFEGENGAVMVNNGDWLLGLNYIDFLRDVGVHFSVNKMLTAECYKSRLEKGLSFLEFNYMLMQGYDFYVLNKQYGCKLECGGDDQWNNMLAGVDLVRRKEQKEVYAMTFSLLTTSEGKKMGKTQKGAVWLDPEKTSPYDFYQYWRNIDDNDVEKCFKLLTFLPLDEIAELTKYNDERINDAKSRLGYELTAIVHGKEVADKVLEQVKAAFSGDTSNMAVFNVPKSMTKLTDIMAELKIAPSKGEARRLIDGGAIRVDEEKIATATYEVDKDEFVIHKGKKTHVKVVRV